MHFLKSLLYIVGVLIPTLGYCDHDHSTDSLDLRIPVVDMSDFYRPSKREAFLNTLYDAMSTVGFFAVRNTGVDREVVDQAYAQAETFFKRDHTFKATCIAPQSNGQRGYVPGETAKGNKVKDFKEFYHFGREGATPLNIWPDQIGFREAIIDLFVQLEHYVIPLQEAIIETINLHAKSNISIDFLNQITQNGESLLRSLYYPRLEKEVVNNLESPLYWAAPHTDIDLLAILPFATQKGLQVEIDGQWLNVVVPSDAFIVNVGDMLENLTNGLFKSAKHRVLALEPDKDRFSMVLFVHPTDETRLDPLPACVGLTGGVQKYASGTRREFLWERLLELGIAPQLLPAYAQTGHTERQIQFDRESPQVVELLLQNKLASPQLLRALEEKENALFFMNKPCGCD